MAPVVTVGGRCTRNIKGCIESSKNVPFSPGEGLRGKRETFEGQWEHTEIYGPHNPPLQSLRYGYRIALTF